MSSFGFTEQIVDHYIPSEVHEGFVERSANLLERTRSRFASALAIGGALEEVPDSVVGQQIQIAVNECKTDLNVLKAVRSLDRYLHTTEWQYEGERKEDHQELALMDILDGLRDGNKDGYVESATSTGKTREIAKLAEAFQQDGLRVLVLAPTKNIANQIIGNSTQKRGISKFAPAINVDEIGRQYDGNNADESDQIVVSTYSSFINFANSGDLGEFDVILADEAHRGLGKKTSQALKTFSDHAVKIGFSATTTFGSNKSLQEVWPYEYHSLSLREAIESDLVAPVQCLTYKTGETLAILDPNNPNFTDRELARLIDLKSRNTQAIKFARNFVEDGRQGIISTIPGGNLAHARHMADKLSEEEIIDKRTNEKRNIVAVAVGGDTIGLDKILEDYEAGRIDILTFVGVLKEGWDSNAASFLINTCPTTSLVKITQQIGRVIRKKPDGTMAIIVDFVDDVVGKKQKTALHALGEDSINHSKVHSSDTSHAAGEAADSYIRGILDADLYQRLVELDGVLLSDLSIPPERQQLERTVEYYEKLLAKDGLSEIDGLPVNLEIRALIDDATDAYYQSHYRLPTPDEIYEHGLQFGIEVRKEAIEDFIRSGMVDSAGLVFNYKNSDEDTMYDDPEEIFVSLASYEIVSSAMVSLRRYYKFLGEYVNDRLKLSETAFIRSNGLQPAIGESLLAPETYASIERSLDLPRGVVSSLVKEIRVELRPIIGQALSGGTNIYHGYDGHLLKQWEIHDLSPANRAYYFEMLNKAVRDNFRTRYPY